MKISEILNESQVIIDLDGRTKDDIINALVSVAGKSSLVTDPDRMRAAVFEREKKMSTGVGSGFAIPHCKTDAVTDIVAAFGITRDPIDYEALDGEPVRLVFLLVGRDNLVGPHIKLLSRISRLMHKEEFRNRLLAKRTPGEVLEAFRQEEAAYAET